MLRVWLIIFCSVAILATLSNPAHAGELRAIGTLVDGTSREMQRRFLEDLREKPRPSYRLSTDFDRHDIAILEDDGFLILRRQNGLFTDTAQIVSRFYASHTDIYDYIIIFAASSFSEDVNPETNFAFELNVSNSVEGIGFPLFNAGPSFSPGLSNLKSIINMNDLGEYNENPSDPLAIMLNTFSGISILAQEVAHISGAFLQADNVNVLGRGATHWNFFFETNGSVMEGNRWRDNGDGTFTTIASGNGYSQLDLYTMGFLPASGVTSPMYMITNPSPNLIQDDLRGGNARPATGVTVSGTKEIVAMENFLGLHVPRNPSFSTSQKSFHMAWILVIPTGTTATPADIEKLDDFRTQFEEQFIPEQTNGVAFMHSELATELIRADFEIRQVAGRPNLTVNFDNDSFGSITGFEWDFGDSTTSTERHPTHTYASSGSYTVRLKVFGAGGPLTVTKTNVIRIGALATYFEDNFETEKNWTLDLNNTATTGHWLRAPGLGSELSQRYGNDTVRVPVQPSIDHTADGIFCMATGLAIAGTGVGSNDVDGGFTGILSPVIDLSTSINPVLEFWSWFVNNAGSSPGRDPFLIEVSDNGGLTWKVAKNWLSSHYFWRQDQIVLKDFVQLNDQFRMRFRVGDILEGSIVEAAIDDIRIFDVDTETAVLVQDLAAVARPGHVLLRWQFGGDSLNELQRLEVQRSASPLGPFAVVGTLSAPWKTMMTFEDDSSADEASESTALWYRLNLHTTEGSTVTTTIKVDRLQDPATNWRTAINRLQETDNGIVVEYSVGPLEAPTKIEIFNVAGKRMKIFHLGLQAVGSHRMVWDRRHSNGQRAAKGVYFVRLSVLDQNVTKKLIVVR